MLTLSPRRTTSSSLVVSPSKRHKTPSPEKLLLTGVFSPTKASRFDLKLPSPDVSREQRSSVDIRHAHSEGVERSITEQVCPPHSHFPLFYESEVHSNFARPSIFGHLLFPFLLRHRILGILSSLSH